MFSEGAVELESCGVIRGAGSRIYVGVCCWFVIIYTAPFLWAQEPNSDDYMEMTLEELMEVTVVSAARQEQGTHEVSSPITVITAEDIHYSGQTNLAEVLQFVPGVDVQRLSRFRYAISVHGLHEFISDRTLVLINGRTAESPLFGGSEYYTLPILLEDIERIEVIRGPGGAAWGANAFNGVINIITKKPSDVTGVLASTTFSEYGDSYSHLRYATTQEDWSWRVSVGYEDLKDSDQAGAGNFASHQSSTVNNLMGFNDFVANDFMRNLRVDNEAHYEVSEQTKLLLGIAHSHAEVGDWEFGGYYPGGNGWYETSRLFTKLEHEFDNGSSGYLQWYGNHANSKIPTLMKWNWMQNDLEGQVNVQIHPAHQTSIGANVRVVRLNTESQNSQNLNYAGEPFDEYFAGGFLIDRWTLNDQWSLEGQFRADYYSETHADWATRLTAFYALDELEDHTLRCSLAKAFRAPYITTRHVESHRLPLGGVLYAYNVELAGDLKNEESYLVELGYAGHPTANTLLQCHTYFQRYERLIGYATTYDGYGLPHHQADNIDGADAWGVESQLTLRRKRGMFSAWYTYNAFQEDKPDQAIRSFLPAKHSVGLSGRLVLADQWTLNANYRYTDTTETLGDDTTLFEIGPTHRLDLTIARLFAKNKGELMLGVSDVFNKTHGPNFAGSGQLTAHDTPGRTFFARMQVNF